MEQHLFDDCIGNPPFEEALKILGDVGAGELTEGQAKFFDMKRKTCRYAPGRRHGQREKSLPVSRSCLSTIPKTCKGN